MSATLTEAQWGDDPLPDWRADPDDDPDPDDELLDVTPPDVVDMLGFDPLEEDDGTGVHADATASAIDQGNALANHDAIREQAAGTVLICHGEDGDTVLFVRHAERGTWEFPGGHLEDGEDFEDAARREMREEIGKVPNGPMSLLMRDRMTGIDYSTFVAHINHSMVPELSEELDDYCWAPPSKPPLPLHPGARLALDRLGMNEHDIARAIADGRMSSPQRSENVWLFAIRISGTGKSYRPDLKEQVWRDPGMWLAPEMQQRVNGLQVIWEHPPGMQLTWPEFEKRSIGAISLPFVKNDELWGIAKIYDDDAATLMLETQLSTSPAVVFRDPTVNQTRRLEGGEHLLIEGPPDLIDHIAVCELGVWDKGGEPTGVAIGDAKMAQEPNSGGDGNEPSLKGIMDALSGINKRIDGIEGTHREEADARKKGDARRRADAFKFSGRKDDDDDDKVRARRDAEEKELEEHEREAGEAEGDARKKAADRRKKADDDDKKADDDRRRADARMKVDAFKFSGRKDDDDDDAHRGRRDAEEGELEKHLEESGETAADAKQHAKDRRKKADDDDDDDARKRGARGDSALHARIAELEASERRRGLMTDTDRDALAAAQQSWDEVAMAFGQRASRPLDGEPVSLYERRHARRFQQHSKKWSGIDLDKATPDMLAIVMPEVRADAMAAAQRNDGGDIDNLVLREVKRKDRGGREISEFYGPVRATLLPFRLPSMRARFTDKGQIGRV